MHETNELLRKTIHIGVGVLAITLKWMPWRLAAVIAAIFVLVNWLVLHRIVGKRVSRQESGYDTGIVLYPIAVCALILIFNWHISLAAVAWILMAFGDGFATLAGRTMPIAPLPWNREKSWGGTIAFVVMGGIAAFAVARFFGSPGSNAVIAALLFSACIESLPLRLNDNFTVPAAAGATLATIAVHPFVGTMHPAIAWPWIVVNTVLAVLGYALRTVDLSGFVAGWLLGIIVILGGGPPLYVALLVFFAIGTACTLAGYKRKARAGLAQERGGRRGAGHAIANVGVAAICSVACWRGLGLVPLFMGITSLATAAADTAGTEVGQWLGNRAWMPLTLRRVDRGTEGAISIEGTLAGALSALMVAIAGTAMAIHQIHPGFMGTVTIDRTHAIAVVAVCGIVGSYIESVTGALVKDVPNNVMNFLNTAIGAFLFWVAWNFVPIFGFEF